MYVPALVEGLGAVDFNGLYYDTRGKKRQANTHSPLARVVASENRRERLCQEQGIPFLWLRRDMLMLDMAMHIQQWKLKIRSSKHE